MDALDRYAVPCWRCSEAARCLERVRTDFACRTALRLLSSLTVAGLLCCSDAERPFQVVVSKMTVPTAAEKTSCAYDFDEDGDPDNQLSEAFAMLSNVGYDPQASVDVHIAQGIFTVLFEVEGAGDLEDGEVVLDVHVGDDEDGGAADNFTGIERFHIDGTRSEGLLPLAGSIRQRRLAAGPVDAPIPVPLELEHADMPLVLMAKQVRFRALLSPSTEAITEGCGTGLLLWREVEQKAVPKLAEYLNDKIKMPTNPKAALHRAVLDANHDDLIGPEELLAVAPLMKLAPDIDSDGDGALDALSVGYRFEAVRAVIDRNRDEHDALACQGIIRCVDHCDEDQPTCIERCQARGTDSGQATFAAVHGCLQRNASVCPEQCVEPLAYKCVNCLEHDDCRGAFDACYADFH